jgi:hypothetical protein
MKRIDLSAVAAIRTSEGWMEVDHIFGEVMVLPPAGNVAMFTVTRPGVSTTYVRADDVREFVAKCDCELFVEESRRIADPTSEPATVPSSFGAPRPFDGRVGSAPMR